MFSFLSLYSIQTMITAIYSVANNLIYCIIFLLSFTHWKNNCVQIQETALSTPLPWTIQIGEKIAQLEK